MFLICVYITMNTLLEYIIYIPYYPQTHMLMAAGVSGHRGHHGHRGHRVLTHAAEDRRKRFGCATNLLPRTDVSSVLASQKNFVVATNSFVQVRLQNVFHGQRMIPLASRPIGVSEQGDSLECLMCLLFICL